jgi:hypothetical protein
LGLAKIRRGNFDVSGLPRRVASIALSLDTGKVDFFGDEAMARTGGAGGQNRTGYARLFRAALYQ